MGQLVGFGVISSTKVLREMEVQAEARKRKLEKISDFLKLISLFIVLPRTRQELPIVAAECAEIQSYYYEFCFCTTCQRLGDKK